MNNKAIWKYFWDINMFNIPFSLILGFISGFLWSVVLYTSFGILIGFLGYKTFKNNEYYTYYNLGFTKAQLLARVWLLNMGISFVIFLTYIIFR